MKKLAALFSDSWHEFSHVQTITVAAMFAAVSIVVGYFSIAVGDFIKIGFSTISNQLVYYLFGPVVGGVFGGVLDLIKYLIKPTGAFFPGFTLVAVVGGVMYGSFFYKRPLTFGRVLAAEFSVSVVCNMLLTTYFLSLLYGKGFLALLPMRVIKNLIMCPINSMIFYTVARTLETAGVFRRLKAPMKRLGARR